MTDNFQEWTATSPGVPVLAHTQYEIRHQKVGGHWDFTVFWRGERVRASHGTLEAAKLSTLNHLNDMLVMGYEP